VHPDHSVICEFRVKNKEAFKEAFTKVLLMARQSRKLKKVGGISVDGTKIRANASKHSAVSYKRAGEMIAELDLEVAELMKKAEDADSAPLEDGLTIPDEIARRNERKAVLNEAKAEMEKMYKEAQEEKAREKAEEEKKKAEKKQAQSVTAEAEPVKSVEPVETVVKPVETEKPAETAAHTPPCLRPFSGHQRTSGHRYPMNEFM
jgi:predicted metalloendopeptidase